MTAEPRLFSDVYEGHRTFRFTACKHGVLRHLECGAPGYVPWYVLNPDDVVPDGYVATHNGQPPRTYEHRGEWSGDAVAWVDNKTGPRS